MKIDIEREIELSAVRASMADRLKAAGHVLRPLVWDVFWAVVILAGLSEARWYWRQAFAVAPDGPAEVVSEYAHQWQIGSQVFSADHITTSAPDIGTGKISAAGWDAQNQMLWSVDNAPQIKRIH